MKLRGRLDHARVGEVAEQQGKGPLEGGDDLLAIHATTVLEQHRAFPLDELRDRGPLPTPDRVLPERPPIGVLGEEALEEPVRKGALQQRAVGDAGDVAAAEPGVVLQDPLVWMEVRLVEARVGLRGPGHDLAAYVPPALLAGQRGRGHRRGGNVEERKLVAVAAQQAVVETDVDPAVELLFDSTPERVTCGAVFVVHHQHQPPPAIQHRAQPSPLLH